MIYNNAPLQLGRKPGGYQSVKTLFMALIVLSIGNLLIFNKSNRAADAAARAREIKYGMSFYPVMEQPSEAEKTRKIVDNKNLTAVSHGKRLDLTSTGNFDVDPLALRPARFLFGIFTRNDEVEIGRRKTIRETWLSYRDPSGKQVICSLADVRNGKLERPEDCVIFYTFVVGGLSNGRTEIFQDSPLPWALKNPDLPPIEPDHDDITYLAIKDNMNLGKSISWFEYASTLEQEIGFDYIAKIDSDTVLCPRLFLKWARATSPPAPYNKVVYGGTAYLKTGANPRRIRGDLYMHGHLYFVSLDLARYFITMSPQKRAANFGGHRLRVGVAKGYPEDVTMGSYVYTHPGPIHIVKMPCPCPPPMLSYNGIREHPLKTPEEFAKSYEEKCVNSVFY
jgi:hypothetical protein